MIGDLVLRWLDWIWNLWGVVPGRPKDRLPKDARKAHRAGWMKGPR